MSLNLITTCALRVPTGIDPVVVRCRNLVWKARWNAATDWTGQGTKIATPFVRLPGLIHGQCVTSNGDSYFSIRLTPGKGPRTKTIPGDILIGKSVLKSWGLHLIDVNLTEGDLVTLAGRQSQAWLAKR